MIKIRKHNEQKTSITNYLPNFDNCSKKVAWKNLNTSCISKVRFTFFCRDIEAVYILEDEKVTYHYHARMSIDIPRRVHCRIRNWSPVWRHHRMLKKSTKLCMRRLSDIEYNNCMHPK